MTDRIIIEVKDLDRDYFTNKNKIEVLKKLNFTIREGEFVGIMGKSGCGKTTLLKVLGTIDDPTNGHLYFNGKDIKDYYGDALAEIRRRKIGFIFQDYYLMDSLSVLENIMLPEILDQVPDEECYQSAMKYADLFELSHLVNKNPYELSGGEKQRVAICRALINDPELILADEPTGNLDTKSGEIVIHTLKVINKKMGKTIILVTHDPKMASYCDRLLLLKDGVITEDMVSEKDQDSFYQTILNKMKEL